MTSSSADHKAQSLGSSARASILWGGGFILLGDVAQFGVMLILVRLISPTDYGTVALAQSIIGFLSVASVGVLIMHAQQLRDPTQVDWQAHFTAGVAINSVLFIVTLATAYILSYMTRFAAAALPLAVLSLSFLLDIPSTLRHRMVQVEHDWMRFRGLIIIGKLLSFFAALVVAWAGGGVWALVIQPLLFGFPATIDLFLNTTWRPDWTWSWARYRDTARFTSSRVVIGMLSTGRGMTEQATMAAAYDFAALGVFTRSVGLATLAAGRIGTVATSAIYPVITRAEQGSAQFRRYSGLVLSGVCWATIAAAAFIALAARDFVSLLYGPNWTEVAPLLPLAVASVGVNGILAAITSLLLANNEVRACFLVDLTTTGLGIVLALWLVPIGAPAYLAGMTVLSLVMVVLATGVLRARGAIDGAGIASAFLPALIAGATAVAAALAARKVLGTSPWLLARLMTDGLVVGVVYVLTLRVAFARQMSTLVRVMPGGRRLEQLLLLPRAPLAA